MVVIAVIIDFDSRRTRLSAGGEEADRQVSKSVSKMDWTDAILYGGVCAPELLALLRYRKFRRTAAGIQAHGMITVIHQKNKFRRSPAGRD